MLEFRTNPNFASHVYSSEEETIRVTQAFENGVRAAELMRHLMPAEVTEVVDRPKVMDYSMPPSVEVVDRRLVEQLRASEL